MGRPMIAGCRRDDDAQADHPCPLTRSKPGATWWSCAMEREMSKAKGIWLGALTLLYLMFWIWYGGNGEPLSPAEGEALLVQMEGMYDMTREEAPEGSMIRNLEAMVPQDDGREFYEVNLETRRSGEDAAVADARYANIVFPLLLVRGGHPVFVSDRAGLMLGNYGAEIDRVAVVRYRSLRDLFDMILDPAMLEGREEKLAALDHSEVFITHPTISFVRMRLVVGLLLLLPGLIGLAVMGRWSRARTA